jgi:hypothetical protein
VDICDAHKKESLNSYIKQPEAESMVEQARKREERKAAHPTTQIIGTGFPVEPDTQMIIKEEENLD